MYPSNHEEQDNQRVWHINDDRVKNTSDFYGPVTNYEDNLEKCILQSESFVENNRKHKNTNVQVHWSLFFVLRIYTLISLA